MRTSAIALILAVAMAFAGCAGDAEPRAAAPPAVATYAAAANRLCSQLVAAIQRAFAKAQDAPDAAMTRYARDVHSAGERFAPAAPPAALEPFHRSAVRHVKGKAASLRRVARLTAAGDADAALQALGDHPGLLPEGIPDTILSRAPGCRTSVAPAQGGPVERAQAGSTPDSGGA